MDVIHRYISENIVELLAETLESSPTQDGTRYVQRGDSLFNTLDALSAKTASTPPVPGAPTLAAHCEHLRFYVEAYLGFMRGSEERVDWASSWTLHSVSETEWELLRQRLRLELEAMVETFKAVQVWEDDPLGIAMNILAHSAYHLGAIRTLSRILNHLA